MPLVIRIPNAVVKTVISRARPHKAMIRKAMAISLHVDVHSFDIVRADACAETDLPAGLRRACSAGRLHALNMQEDPAT